jgi:hypothetical protein
MDFHKIFNEALIPYIAGIFGYMSKRWVGEMVADKLIKPLVNILKKKLIKTERDMAVYLHGYNETANNRKAGE